MGEAKRRKKLDPNYGSSNVLKDVCQLCDDLLLQQAQSGEDAETTIFLFTNKDRGCNDLELELLQKEIPLRYQDLNTTVLVLPKKYAHLPAELALDYFVPLNNIECT